MSSVLRSPKSGRALRLESTPAIPGEKFEKLARDLLKNRRLLHSTQRNPRYSHNKVNSSCFWFLFFPLNDLFSASLIRMDCKPRSRSSRRVLSFPPLSATSYAPLELHVFQGGLGQQMTMSSLRRKEMWAHLSSHSRVWKRKYGLCLQAVKNWMRSTIRKTFGLFFSSKLYIYVFLLAT